MLPWRWRYSKCIFYLSLHHVCSHEQPSEPDEIGEVFLISSSISTLGVSLPPRTDRLSTGDILTVQALSDPRAFLVFPPCSNLSPSHWPQVGKPRMMMDPMCPQVLGSLHSVLESQESPYHTINEWNESQWWNFRHRVMAAAKIIFGQGPFLASLRMCHVGSCPAHSSFPSASNGEWDKKKSCLL